LWDRLDPDDQTDILVCQGILAYVKASHRPFPPLRRSAGLANHLARYWLAELLFSCASKFTGHDQERRKLAYDIISKIEQATPPTRTRAGISELNCVSLFLGLACRYGLDWFVRQRLLEIPSSEDRRQVLNHYGEILALDVVFVEKISIPLSDAFVHSLNALLEAGADPSPHKFGPASRILAMLPGRGETNRAISGRSRVARYKRILRSPWRWAKQKV